MAAKSVHLQVVEIPVKDLEESAKWYMDMFDIGLHFKDDDEIGLGMNGMGFILVRSNEIPRLDFISAKGEIKPILTFQVDNIHELREEMVNKGVDALEMMYKPGGGYSFQFFDPNGNHLGIWGGWPKEEDERLRT